MPRSLLKDVDADGVDLVGSAANRRSFALFKAHDTQPRKKSTSSGDDPMTVKATKAAFRKHLEVLGVPDVADLTDEALLEKATAVGYELVEKTVDPTPDPKAVEKGVLATLRKMFAPIFGRDPDADPDDPFAQLDKTTLPPEARAAFAALSAEVRKSREAIVALTTSRAAEQRAALTTRATALQKSGFLERDAKLEELTEPEIAALEKAQTRIHDRLKKAGVLESFGTVDATDKPATLREMVYKAVVDYLGREPTGKIEEIQIRKKIYDANPGLAQAAREEEKRERGVAV